MEWKPIETAPRDDTAVLGKLPDSDIPMPVRYRNGKWVVTWDLHPLSQYDIPTHWMPLPDAPNAGGNSAGACASPGREATES